MPEQTQCYAVQRPASRSLAKLAAKVRNRPPRQAPIEVHPVVGLVAYAAAVSRPAAYMQLPAEFEAQLLQLCRPVRAEPRPRGLAAPPPLPPGGPVTPVTAARDVSSFPPRFCLIFPSKKSGTYRKFFDTSQKIPKQLPD